LYVSLSWWLLVLAGETALTDSFANFIYYLMVTASTVGYGDHSPVTDMGKWVVVLFVIPGGLSLFAALLGRVAGSAM
ncbi:potassium channel family protein, partial [Escherichia coli]|nr:potassium channel family protein [Escherichia coli]